MKQQDTLIHQLRQAEQLARTDVRTMKRTEAEEGSKRHLTEQLLVEADQKLKLADHTVLTSKKRNTEFMASVWRESKRSLCRPGLLGLVAVVATSGTSPALILLIH